MITAAILVATAVLLKVTGLTWVEIAIAVSSIFLLVHSSMFAQRWIERQTGRTVARNSESYAALYFGISLGITLPFMYFYPDSHLLLLGVVVFVASTIGTVTSIALFGSRTLDREQD